MSDFDKELWGADEAAWEADASTAPAANPFPIDTPEHHEFERQEAATRDAVRRAREGHQQEPEVDGDEQDRWPVMANDAYYGLAGDVVATLDPYTEADPAGVLFAFLAFGGCYFGTRPHVRGGNTRHPGRIWPILAGSTASGAKGTAVAAASQVIEAVDENFTRHNRAAGLSTSEGLIRRVRDSTGDPSDKDFDEGVMDKRLFVNEPEFASVLGRARREGNTLSATLRDAYDGVVLQTLVSHSPLKATDHHITVVAAITPQELIEKLTATDVANGLANRFMVVASRRSKLLPDGGDPPQRALADLAGRFRGALSTVKGVQQMRRTDAAARLWADEYHHRFGRKFDEGPVAAMFARWHAHSARMSVIYALLDGQGQVDVAHVRASLAAWDYVEASVRYVFGAEDCDRDLGRLVEYIDAAQLGGRSRKEVSVELFGKHKTKKELDVVFAKLLDLGRYEMKKVATAGRPQEFYMRKAGGGT